jgi:hypothetical protein
MLFCIEIIIDATNSHHIPMAGIVIVVFTSVRETIA